MDLQSALYWDIEPARQLAFSGIGQQWEPLYFKYDRFSSLRDHQRMGRMPLLSSPLENAYCMAIMLIQGLQNGPGSACFFQVSDLESTDAQRTRQLAFFEGGQQWHPPNFSVQLSLKGLNRRNVKEVRKLQYKLKHACYCTQCAVNAWKYNHVQAQFYSCQKLTIYNSRPVK